MYIKDVHNYGDSGEPVQAVADKYLELIKETIRKEYETLVDYAASTIEDEVARRCESFLEGVLKGDVRLAEQAISAESRAKRYRDGEKMQDPWAKVYADGSIWETAAMEIRRRLAEAHRDLITDQRIMDLEATVEGLRKQNQALLKRCGDWF